MSVWLTPELKSLFGGTYFPPDDRYYGRPGFKTVLTSLAEQVGNLFFSKSMNQPVCIVKL